MSAYPTHEAGPSGWTEWIQPRRAGYKVACCDCGMVHRWQFRLHNGHIQIRASLDRRATGQVRRHKKAKP